jgi:hypothetical protein
MKNRRGFLLAMVAGLTAAAVIITPVIADELIGAITKVDIAGMKVTVVEKGTDKEVVVTVTPDTETTAKGEIVKGVDLEKLSKKVAKNEADGKKTMVTVTHEKGVSSKLIFAKKKAN